MIEIYPNTPNGASSYMEAARATVTASMKAKLPNQWSFVSAATLHIKYHCNMRYANPNHKKAVY